MLGAAASAQNPTVRRITPFPDGFGQMRLEASSRAAIGITTSSGSTSRDTLGGLVSSGVAAFASDAAGARANILRAAESAIAAMAQATEAAADVVLSHCDLLAPGPATPDAGREAALQQLLAGVSAVSDAVNWRLERGAREGICR